MEKAKDSVLARLRARYLDFLVWKLRRARRMADRARVIRNSGQ